MTENTNHKPLVDSIEELGTSATKTSKNATKSTRVCITRQNSPHCRISLRPGMPVKCIGLNIHMLNQHFDTPRTQLQNVIMQDLTLNELTKVIIAGWPTDRSSYPPTLLPYLNFREVGIQDGVLLKGNMIIIPASLQQDLLQQLPPGD